MKLEGLEIKFILSADHWDAAGDFGDIMLYNTERPLELTDYAKEVLKDFLLEDDPFMSIAIYPSASEVIFYRRNDESGCVKIQVELTCTSLPEEVYL